MSVLGLGTPEVERWIKAGKGEDKVGKAKEDTINAKGKSKTVYFKDDTIQNEDAEEVEELLERARKISLQISPRRPVPSTSGSTVDSWAAIAANSPAISVMSHPANTSAASNPPTTAHDLLKTIVQDVMFDFQRETKAEMMGLHLDLLRMGRSWKAELRTLMDEYVGDLREMREENERLRKENERLRRGWQ
jgi:protein NEDD1